MEMINKYHTTHDTNEYGLATQYFYFWTHYSENMPIVAHASELAYGMSLPLLLSVVSSLTMPCDDDDGGDDDDEYTNLSFFSASCCFLFIYSSPFYLHLPSPSFTIPLSMTVFHMSWHFDTSIDRATSDIMATYWGNFLLHSDPNDDGHILDIGISLGTYPGHPIPRRS